MASALRAALNRAVPAFAWAGSSLPRFVYTKAASDTTRRFAPLARPGGGGHGRAASSGGGEATQAPPEDSHLLQCILSGILAPYWNNTPTAEAVVGLLEEQYPESSLGLDHLAFRTFGVEGLGIASVASLFQDFGYQQRDELTFPKKKLRALWFSPPDPQLPRVFVSEVKVEELTPAAQAVIQSYVGGSAAPALLGKYGMLSSLVGVPPWVTPTLQDYRLLAEESEYAAWVLVNGYALNHATVAVHRLEGHTGGLETLNGLLQQQEFLMNQEGGLVKASPDGLLLQSSTMADTISFCFAGGESELVPASYVEFAERLVLPQFADLKAEDVQECHRRDGFEAANADKIFESTSLPAPQ